MSNKKQPWMKFFPSDWLGDAGLRSCSAAARGLWIDMLCLMHQTTPVGYLKIGEAVIDEESLARMVSLTKIRLTKLLQELEKNHVFSREKSTNSIYSRRMVHDNRLSLTRKAVGKLGGNPVLLNQDVNPRSQKPEARVIESEENTYSTPTPPQQILTAENLAPRKYGEKFLLFWVDYPKDMRIGKREAWQIWHDRNLDAEFDELVAGLKRYKRSQLWQKEGGRFIMSPVKFLGKTKWDDEPGLSEANRSTI